MRGTLTMTTFPVLLFRNNTRRESISLCFFTRSTPANQLISTNDPSAHEHKYAPTPCSAHRLFPSSSFIILYTLLRISCVVSSSSSPSPSLSCTDPANNGGGSSPASFASPPSLPSSEGCFSFGGPNTNGFGAFDAAAKDAGASPSFGGLPKPNPTGFPMLPTAGGLPNPPNPPFPAAPSANLGGVENENGADDEEEEEVVVAAMEAKEEEVGKVFSGVVNAEGVVEDALPKRLVPELEADGPPKRLLPLAEVGKALFNSALILSLSLSVPVSLPDDLPKAEASANPLGPDDSPDMSSDEGRPFPSAENAEPLLEAEGADKPAKEKGDASPEGAGGAFELDEPKLKGEEPDALPPNLISERGAELAVELAPSLSPPLGLGGAPKVKLPGAFGITNALVGAGVEVLFFSVSFAGVPFRPPTFSSNFFFSDSRRLWYVSNKLPTSTNGSVSMAFLTVVSRDTFRPRICER